MREKLQTITHDAIRDLTLVRSRYWASADAGPVKEGDTSIFRYYKELEGIITKIDELMILVHRFHDTYWIDHSKADQ